jgi:protein arginine kinase activator
MKCSICKKEEATFHYTEIKGKQIIKLHLCEGCAKEKGVGLEWEEMFPHFSLTDLLGGLTGLELEEKKIKVRKCPLCGLTFDKFQSKGRLGCSECYQTFSPQLNSLLRKIHGATRHTGKQLSLKKAEVVKREEEIERLEKELREAIKKEEYERAAEIRDELRRLKRKNGTASNG